MEIKVKKLKENAKMPFRATSGSAGADLFACLDEDVTIMPGMIKSIPIGIAIALDSERYGAFIFPRSSLSCKFGVTLPNCVGVVDSDYRGEIIVPLINHSSEPYTVKNGDRVAQMVIMPVEQPFFSESETLDSTERGSGGFGSTGK